MRRVGLVSRAGARIAVLIAVIIVAGHGAPPALAQTELSITTPFPAVSVQPGGSVAFELTVSAAEPARVDLSVDGLPDGWSASLSGGGNEIHGVYVDANAPATVELSIEVPEGAAPGDASVEVVGSGGGESTSLALELTVTEEAGGEVTLESDYPQLRGSVDDEFQFNLTLNNDTPQQLTFNLEAQGPPGWEVTVQPSGEARAASVTVDGRSTQRLEVRTTPPPQTEPGTYQIGVVVGAGEERVPAELTVEVTGSVEMELTSGDGRLNTTANAGAARGFDVVVVNRGTSPLTAVQLSGRGPSEWEVTFEPATIDQIPPEGSATATAQITPSGNAVAGDYVVTFSAAAEATQEEIEVRVTVETAPIWGIVGIGLIALTLGGMVWVFRRYGRR
jgi:uncharacterized membrane protein